MLNIVCVKYGHKYGPEYVNILFDMVRRNLQEGFEGRFVCFTDDPTGLDDGIETRPLPDFLSSWWTKLYLFSPGLFPEGERILYFDLDVVITGWLDDVAAYDGEFAILKEFYNNPGWQSSIMAWRSGAKCHIWERWIEQGMPQPAGGDQDWIEQVAGSADMLQDLFPEAFLSYKVHCLLFHPPVGTKVVVFHGEPKPDNCGEKWVQMVWRIGGGTAAQLELVCNTDDEKLKENIRYACKLDYPWLEMKESHDGHAVIVGGGPSAKDLLDEIKWRKNLGQHVFALNGSYKWLAASGISPDALVVLDARAENAEFIPQETSARLYLCSHCSSDVFKKAEGKDVIVWHCHTPVLDDALENPTKKPECLIAAGTTVGLGAMAISYALGYRKLHLYGMDSNFRDGEHHAYSQPLNDEDKILDVVFHDKPYRAAAWMVAQATQFQFLSLALAEGGAEITIHGESLLKDVAKAIEEGCKPDTEVVERNGVFWPSKDKIGNPHITAALSGIPSLVEICEQRRVAVQAGGNVGLFPRELAKYFGRVITFEPDALNFKCMELNCSDDPRIEKRNQALGDSEGKVSLYRDTQNCGAHVVIPGDEVVVTTIDSLSLTECDLLQLDVEGYELNVLKGAERTIDRCRPVISLELKMLGRNFGVKDEDIEKWLAAKNYECVKSIGQDKIFLPI